jgi:hypothetical protein
MGALTAARKPVETALGLASLLLGWLAWYLTRGKHWFSAYVEDMRKPALLMTVWLGALMAAEMALSRLALAAEDSLALARQRMVAEQLSGPGRNITNAHVLAAMGKVPRHEFVPQSLRSLGYEDCPLPIGHDQTISQPYIVALLR